MEDIVKATRRACRLIRAHSEEECCPWSIESCRRAMRGEAVPDEVHCDVTRLCIISGIRHHHDYARELRGTGDALFIRALNARQIMSGSVPEDMSDPEHLPYCIWYPEVAPESTYREVARRFPQLKYHVGRACAVAGYSELFRELDLLPDISIADEAKDNIASSKPGCKRIFDHIMSQRQRWLVMDDYTRTVRELPVPARYGLNGDTATRSSLDRRLGLVDPDDFDMAATSDTDDDSFAIYFNITEDFSIGVEGSDEYDTYNKNKEMAELLWTPLPDDLPPGNKDVLILSAAWHGDIDRYARLRRPHNYRLDREDSMIARGIHHSPMFAKWWTTRPTSERVDLETSITARYIMSNDLSRVPLAPEQGPEDRFPRDLPYTIWLPQPALLCTYAELLRRQPAMRPAVARAYIVMNEQEQWLELDPKPDAGLLDEARKSPNPFYVSYLLEKSRRLDLDPNDLAHPLGLDHDDYAFASLPPEEFATHKLVPFPTASHFGWVERHETGRYNGYEADASQVELFVCAPEQMRPPPCVEYLNLNSLYWASSTAGEPGKPLESYLQGGFYHVHPRPKQQAPWDCDPRGCLLELPPSVERLSDDKGESDELMK